LCRRPRCAASAAECRRRERGGCFKCPHGLGCGLWVVDGWLCLCVTEKFAHNRCKRAQQSCRGAQRQAASDTLPLSAAETHKQQAAMLVTCATTTHAHCKSAPSNLRACCTAPRQPCRCSFIAAVAACLIYRAGRIHHASDTSAARAATPASARLASAHLRQRTSQGGAGRVLSRIARARRLKRPQQGSARAGHTHTHTHLLALLVPVASSVGFGGVMHCSTQGRG
jgi:hypothetical protein